MRILGISGSLRRGSHNRKLLRAAAAALPPGVDLMEWDGLAGLPAFDEDQEETPAEPVRAFLDLIASADALLIATPEYNASLPGALKNALDWASRPFPSSVLRGKPSAVIGASTGPFSAVWTQAELRKDAHGQWRARARRRAARRHRRRRVRGRRITRRPDAQRTPAPSAARPRPRGLTCPESRSIRGPDRVPMTMRAVGYRENLDVGDP